MSTFSPPGASRPRVVVMSLLAALVATSFLAFSAIATRDGAIANEKDAAVERTRKTVRMLDDIYKTAVVLITDKYVHDEDDFPAGSAAVALFEAIKKKGWHEVRLLDATGKPVREKNSPKDDFEKAAVAALRGGKSYHESLTRKDGKPYLRAATPVPVVSEKCIMCHAHYKDAPDGSPIGVLSYTVPVE